MKKLFVIFLLMLLSILPCFAEYKPIPKELSKQYKKHMEKIINQSYPQVIKDMDEYFNNIEKDYNIILQHGCNPNISLYQEVSIYDLNLFMYDRLLRATQEQYLKKTYQTFDSDDYTVWANFLYQYFKDNNVDIKKINLILEYAETKDNIIKQYQNHIDKVCYGY